MAKPPFNKPLKRSVTGRIDDISQPRGGYLNIKSFKHEQLGSGIEALDSNAQGNLGLIGSAVDYLTRVVMGTDVKEAFKVSLAGAEIVDEYQDALALLENVKGIDAKSITCAYKLAGYDVACRVGKFAYYCPVSDIVVDDATISNIAEMVKRSVAFFDKVGSKVLDGFTFEDAYTDFIAAGDGDYLTADTLWDFKTSKNEPKKEDTLQLLVYWQMGLRSVHSEFQQITRLGIFNPRLNIMYTIETDLIEQSVIDEVCHDVIGYGLEPLEE
jgi:hypothetical protein